MLISNSEKYFLAFSFVLPPLLLLISKKGIKDCTNLNDRFYLTKFIKGDIGHVTNVPLVLLDGLGPGNDGVGHITVGAPADEGFPVIVHFAAVHLWTILFTVFQNHFHKHCKTDSTIVRL